jgi:hypothetical protein
MEVLLKISIAIFCYFFMLMPMEATTATATVTLTATVPSTGTLTATPAIINYGVYTGLALYGLSTLQVTTNNPAATLSASSTTGNLTAVGSSTPISYALTQASSSSTCTNAANVGTSWATINPSPTGNYYTCFSLGAVTNPSSGTYTTTTPITFTLTY